MLTDIIRQHNNAIDIETRKLDEYFFDVKMEDKPWISPDLKATEIHDTLNNTNKSEGAE